MLLVRVRILGTGQVEDFIPAVAHNLVTSGRGEYVNKPIETAAIKPSQQQAILGAPLFKLGPRMPR